jgi:hypothetical protein
MLFISPFDEFRYFRFVHSDMKCDISFFAQRSLSCRLDYVLFFRIIITLSALDGTKMRTNPSPPPSPSREHIYFHISRAVWQ